MLMTQDDVDLAALTEPDPEVWRGPIQSVRESIDRGCTRLVHFSESLFQRSRGVSLLEALARFAPDLRWRGRDARSGADAIERGSWDASIEVTPNVGTPRKKSTGPNRMYS